MSDENEKLHITFYRHASEGVTTAIQTSMKVGKGVIDFVEAATINKPHPLLPSSSKDAAIRIAVVAVGVGAAATFLTVAKTGAVAIAGIVLLDGAKNALYRSFRAWFPEEYSDGDKNTPSAQTPPPPAPPAA